MALRWKHHEDVQWTVRFKYRTLFLHWRHCFCNSRECTLSFDYHEHLTKCLTEVVRRSYTCVLSSRKMPV
jgi:hypothetical protein